MDQARSPRPGTADVGRMSGLEPRAFAAGYLEALADAEGERRRLGEDIARLAGEAAQARAEADAVWRQALAAAAGHGAARAALHAIDTVRERAGRTRR